MPVRAERLAEFVYAPEFALGVTAGTEAAELANAKNKSRFISLCTPQRSVVAELLRCSRMLGHLRGVDLAGERKLGRVFQPVHPPSFP